MFWTLIALAFAAGSSSKTVITFVGHSADGASFAVRDVSTAVRKQKVECDAEDRDAMQERSEPTWAKAGEVTLDVVHICSVAALPKCRHILVRHACFSIQKRGEAEMAEGLLAAKIQTGASATALAYTAGDDYDPPALTIPKSALGMTVDVDLWIEQHGLTSNFAAAASKRPTLPTIRFDHGRYDSGKPVAAGWYVPALERIVVAARKPSDGDAGWFTDTLYFDSIAPADLATRFKRAQDDARALNDRGMDAHRAGQFEEAAKLFSDATQTDESYGQAYFNAACAYARSGKLEEARHHALKAIDLDAKRFLAKLKTDADLAALRNDEDFQAALRKR